VALRLHGDLTAKPYSLKVSGPFDGSTVHASIKKITPGLYDLIVTVKGSDPVVVDSAFTARAPLVSGISSATIAPGDSVDINGTFFGTKKGKVTIGDVTAKVTFWSDGKITVVVSKKNQSGSAAFDIFGKGGTQDDAATATVVAPISGKNHFSLDADVSGKSFTSTDNQTTFASDNVGTFVLNTARVIGGGLDTSNHSLTVNVGGALAANTFGNAVVFATYQEVGLNGAIYTSQGTTDWTVTITQRVGSRVEGTCSGTLKKSSAAFPGPAQFGVTCDFILSVK
jgi:hypothetical protein